MPVMLLREPGGVKIAEVVETVFGDAQLPFRAVRTGLGRTLSDGTLAGPLELALLRPVPKRAAASIETTATLEMAAPVEASIEATAQ